ncbi:hypothetical protein BCF55_0221 [Hydrogenivirga caldilitoris]|uniref:Uncharacterized protein n=1 Tax=Hydrogenivirga caldilitoris TaxID=246264 RepID=A0A497XNX3_9AQUI|nr:hypothetical protein [Hydrogenivirga caldilitoris]RLJ69961.1 hypothetical protein BCF55_0221 [Hydrogenivirga caldilitoris]
MARKGKRRGGPRYKKVSLSLPKRLYLVLSGIAMGDDKKLNRLIKGILEDKLQESTVAELELYLKKAEEEEKEEEGTGAKP